jgi:hypothetical protein
VFQAQSRIGDGLMSTVAFASSALGSMSRPDWVARTRHPIRWSTFWRLWEPVRKSPIVCTRPLRNPLNGVSVELKCATWARRRCFISRPDCNSRIAAASIPGRMVRPRGSAWLSSSHAAGLADGEGQCRSSVEGSRTRNGTYRGLADASRNAELRRRIPCGAVGWPTSTRCDRQSFLDRTRDTAA